MVYLDEDKVMEIIDDWLRYYPNFDLQLFLEDPAVYDYRDLFFYSPTLIREVADDLIDRIEEDLKSRNDKVVMKNARDDSYNGRLSFSFDIDYEMYNIIEDMFDILEHKESDARWIANWIITYLRRKGKI